MGMVWQGMGRLWGPIWLLGAAGLACGACADEEGPGSFLPKAQGEGGSGGRSEPTSGESGSGGTAGSPEPGGGRDDGGAPPVPAGGQTSEGAGTSGAGGMEPEEHHAPTCEEPVGRLPPLRLREIAALYAPVQLTSPPGDSRVFVVSRDGYISVLDHDVLLPEPFLVLPVDLHYAELGLLGLAFHPGFADNGLFYVHRILPPVGDQMTGDLVVEEYERDPENPNLALVPARRELIRIPQPSHKHKGGTLEFDRNGLLYIAIGNGGEQLASNDATQLRGKVLRIDPNIGGDSYAIPASNPQHDGWAPEILETGLRNPWRIALDGCNDDLYIADVGNATWEEIDVSQPGARGNEFGFPSFEGTERVCKSCADVEQVEPVVQYSHADGCSVIGGVVYRGHAIPALRGAYLYSDLCTGIFRTLRYVGGEVKEELDLTEDLNPDGVKNISSFGEDADGEIYVLNIDPGTVYRIEPE